MQPQSPRRRRGVLLTAAGLKKLKDSIRILENQNNQGEKFTLEDLSQQTGLDAVTISRVLQAETGVDKRTLERFFRSVQLELESSDYTRSSSSSAESAVTKEPPPSDQTHIQQDLSEAIDVSTFYGRETELAQLKQWILNDRCRLVIILGMGGMGKTALSVKLAQALIEQGERDARTVREEATSPFEYVIWKSLRNAPLLPDLVSILIQAFSQPELTSSTDSDVELSQFFNALRQFRCLIVLDNVESILQSGRTGRYREGYEAYGQFFQCIGETVHQSCVLLTSRERPREIAFLEGQNLPVRTLRLRGLQEGQAILRARGNCVGTDAEWQSLVDHYGGNPLALKMVAPAVQVFETVNEFLRFLQRGNLVFEDIRDLLNQQFERISELEQEVMYWLAIQRESLSLLGLRSHLLPLFSERELLEAILTLESRSLIERQGTQFTLQPVMLEYVTEQLVEQLATEITAQRFVWLRRCSIITATANREAQIRFIHQPIRDRLMDVFVIRSNLEDHLNQLLTTLQSEPPSEQGYAVDNIINLLQIL
ncbi:MAG: AAA family ATPase [Leptolyngbya sp. BL-A-14]